jgi:CheY-like chemotaxis protein
MQPKILLVDDREDNLLSIEAILANDGYQFVRAYSGHEALRILLNEYDFAMILMDVKMPVLSGFETAALIQEREKLRHIPIIFITANNYGDENIFKGYLAGGIDYIFKPINPEVLRAKVAVFLDIYKKNALLFEQEQKLAISNSALEKEIHELRVSNNKMGIVNTNLQKDVAELASILLSSKLAGDCFEFEQCDLNELLKGFISDMDNLIMERLGTVSIDLLPTLKVSRILMRPLFETLIRNALSATKENVKPIIKIRSEVGLPDLAGGSKTQYNNKYCQIIFEHNGIGFDQKDVDSMFTSHSDGSRLNKHSNGLALCKKIMDRHSGFILATSKIEEGSTFTVSFPMFEIVPTHRVPDPSENTSKHAYFV